MGNQVSKNGDAGKRIVIRMDVEGSEWESLLKTPDTVLGVIDQMAVEFHEVEKPAFLATVERMKRFFYVAHVHLNNFKRETGSAGALFEMKSRFQFCHLKVLHRSRDRALLSRPAATFFTPREKLAQMRSR